MGQTEYFMLLSMSVAPTNRRILFYFPGRWSRHWQPVHISIQLCLHNGPVALAFHDCMAEEYCDSSPNQQASQITQGPSLCLYLSLSSMLSAALQCPVQTTPFMASSSLLHLNSVHPPGLGPIFLNSSLYPAWVGVPSSLLPRSPGILSQSWSFYPGIFALCLPQKTRKTMTIGISFLFAYSAASSVLDQKRALFTSNEWRDIWKGQNH